MPTLQRSIDYLQELVSFPSVSSTSNRAVSDWVAEQLVRLGFEVEQTSYLDEKGIEKVNVVGRRDPSARTATGASAGNTGLAYFCHTDVVPAVGWTGPGGDPFAPRVVDDRLYGRGACDMKGSLSAMLTAAHAVNAADQTAPLWIVCTADEEVGFAGVKHLVHHSEAYRDLVACQPVSVIGEPTRLKVVHAHKGIVGMRVVSRGRAAHSSTSAGVNANLRMIPLLQTLLEIQQEVSQRRELMDDRFDPPTLSWNFGVSDACSAINITPERSVAWVSLRPMPQIDGRELIERVEARAAELGLEFQRIDGGSPMWMDPDSASVRDFSDLAGCDSPITVCYGTDGGELTELEHRLVFGPGDIAQAHTTDEWIELDQLGRGVELFSKAIRRWCTDSDS